GPCPPLAAVYAAGARAGTGRGPTMALGPDTGGPPVDPTISADSHVAEIEACYMDIDPRYRDRRPRPADDPQVGAYFEIADFPMRVPMGSACRAATPPEKWNVPIHWDELHPAGWD